MNLDQRLCLHTAALGQHSPFLATVLRDDVGKAKAKKGAPTRGPASNRNHKNETLQRSRGGPASGQRQNADEEKRQRLRTCLCSMGLRRTQQEAVGSFVYSYRVTIVAADRVKGYQIVDSHETPTADTQGHELQQGHARRGARCLTFLTSLRL